MISCRLDVRGTEAESRGAPSGAVCASSMLVLIKPSHYDDDGYVIRWWRAMIPSNSLAAVYGIAVDCAERQCARRRRRHRHRGHRRDQHPRRRAGAAGALRARRQFRPGGAGRRAVEPVSPRARYRAAVPGGGHPGRHGRLPCLRLPLDARRQGGRSRRLPRHGHLHVRGRGRGPARSACCATPPAARSSRSTIS